MTSFATLTTSTGAPLSVLSLTLTLPIRGAWHGRVEIDATDDETPLEGDAVRLSMGGRSWSGYVLRSQPWNGRARLLIEAGRGGMRQVIGAASYASVLLSTVVARAVSEAGELLALDSAVPTDVLALHARAEGPAGTALTRALDGTAYAWRFNDNGEVWWGLEEWPVAPTGGVLELEPFGDVGSTIVAPLAPTLSPGQVWAGRPVERVIYTLGDEGLEAELVYRRSPTQTGDVRGLFERAVRAQVRELPYLAHYPATVVRQAAAGLELQPDSPTQPGTPPLAPVYGLPGVRTVVPPGSRVGLVYEAGDPHQPRAAGWEEGAAADEIEIEASEEIRLGAGATRGAVRLDDLGTAGTISAGVGPVTFVYVGPNDTLWSATLAAGATPVTAIITPISGTPGALVTQATRASSKVKVE